MKISGQVAVVTGASSGIGAVVCRELAEKDAVFRLLEQRPYALTVSAHAHFQEHRFYALVGDDGLDSQICQCCRAECG